MKASVVSTLSSRRGVLCLLHPLKPPLAVSQVAGTISGALRAASVPCGSSGRADTGFLGPPCPVMQLTPGTHKPAHGLFCRHRWHLTGRGSHRCPLPPRGEDGTGPCGAPAWFRKLSPCIFRGFHSLHHVSLVQFLVELPAEIRTSLIVTHLKTPVVVVIVVAVLISMK